MWTLRHTYSSSLAGVNKVLHKVSTEFSKDACRVPWKLDGVGLKPEPEPPESLGSSKSTDRLCNFFVCCVVKKIVNSISGCKIFRFIRDAHFLGILEYLVKTPSRLPLGLGRPRPACFANVFLYSKRFSSSGLLFISSSSRDGSWTNVPSWLFSENLVSCRSPESNPGHQGPKKRKALKP